MVHDRENQFGQLMKTQLIADIKQFFYIAICDGVLSRSHGDSGDQIQQVLEWSRIGVDVNDGMVALGRSHILLDGHFSEEGTNGQQQSFAELTCIPGGLQVVRLYSEENVVIGLDDQIICRLFAVVREVVTGSI